MVMQADVVNDAYESIKDSNAKVIYMSPQGKVLNQKKVEQLSKEDFNYDDERYQVVIGIVARKLL